MLLLEPYSYGLAGKLAYLVRLVRGMYHLQTARLFIVDNAYLPIHVAPHRRRTTVVQVWHAAGALKRFGLDTAAPMAEPERTFLHRYYDAVVVGGEWTRGPYAAALRTPIERVLALGSPRTDFFFDEAALAAARERVLAAHPELAGRRVILYAPTFRGRGLGKRAATGLDAAALRAALPADHALVLKTHPNLDPAATPTAGYDVVADPTAEINDLLALTDVLVTDYSSSVIEFALLRRPIVLLVGDLADVRGRSRSVPRLPDRDDRHPGDRHGRGHRRDRQRTVRLHRLRRLRRPAARAPRGAVRATASSTASWRPDRRPSSEVIPFRAMSATSEVPAAFRNAAGDRSPLALIREAHRGRPVAAAAGPLPGPGRRPQARRRHAARQHLVGPRSAPPDARLRRLRDDHRHEGQPPDYPLFIFSAILPWKWFTASITDATASIVGQDQLIKQIQFPKIVLPVAATDGRDRQLRVRDRRRSVLLMLFFPDRISPVLLLIPVIAAVQFVFTLACAFWSPPATSSSGTSATSWATSCACGGSCRPACTASPSLDQIKVFKEHPVAQTIVDANPFAILFEAYRTVIYGTTDGAARTAEPGLAGRLLVAQHPASWP